MDAMISIHIFFIGLPHLYKEEDEKNYMCTVICSIWFETT
jgi:hypothetical protein